MTSSSSETSWPITESVPFQFAIAACFATPFGNDFTFRKVELAAVSTRNVSMRSPVLTGMVSRPPQFCSGISCAAAGWQLRKVIATSKRSAPSTARRKNEMRRPPGWIAWNMIASRLLSGLHGAGQKLLHLVPIFFAEAFAQAGWGALPVGQRFLELLAARRGELQILLAAVGSGNSLDQFVAQERAECAAERGGIDRENSAQLRLRGDPRERQGVQQAKLCDGLAAGLKYRIVELGDDARGAPRVGARAGELGHAHVRCLRLFRWRHTHVYTSFRGRGQWIVFFVLSFQLRLTGSWGAGCCVRN